MVLEAQSGTGCGDTACGQGGGGGRDGIGLWRLGAGARGINGPQLEAVGGAGDETGNGVGGEAGAVGDRRPDGLEGLVAYLLRVLVAGDGGAVVAGCGPGELRLQVGGGHRGLGGRRGHRVGRHRVGCGRPEAVADGVHGAHLELVACAVGEARSGECGAVAEKLEPRAPEGIAPLLHFV